jgi:hypothetical protein
VNTDTGFNPGEYYVTIVSYDRNGNLVQQVWNHFYYQQAPSYGRLMWYIDEVEKKSNNNGSSFRIKGSFPAYTFLHVMIGKPDGISQTYLAYSANGKDILLPNDFYVSNEMEFDVTILEQGISRQSFGMNGAFRLKPPHQQ